MKIFHILCLTLFLSLQYSILLSNNSIFVYIGLSETLETNNSDLSILANKNNILKKEIEHISSNNEFLEVYARENFGYIKQNEIFYQIIKDEK